MKSLGVFLFTLMSIAFSASAQEKREFYNGIRYLGMGGAGIAIANDETALAVNPAGLGRVRDFYGTIIDPELDISWNLTNMYRNTTFSQPTVLDNVMPTVLNNAGTYFHASQQIMPSFVARNFGIGFLSRTTLDLEANDPAHPNNVNAFYRDDMAFLLGYNLRLWDGRIKIGFTGKIVSRIELNEPALDASGAIDKPSLAAAGKLKEGVGAGADVGIMLTAPWKFLPTLAATVHDVGGTPYDKLYGVRDHDATTRPDASLQDADVGISISPIMDNKVRSTWSLQYNNVLTASSEPDKAKLIHFGMEYNFGDIVFLRAGYNQRYWTAGFELASERFQFQLASYGEEIGTVDAPREDRRYLVKVGLRF